MNKSNKTRFHEDTVCHDNLTKTYEKLNEWININLIPESFFNNIEIKSGTNVSLTKGTTVKQNRLNVLVDNGKMKVQWGWKFTKPTQRNLESLLVWINEQYRTFKQSSPSK